MNQQQEATTSWPEPSAPRLRSVGGVGNQQLPALARRTSAAVPMGGLRAATWQVARLSASSVRLVRVATVLPTVGGMPPAAGAMAPAAHEGGGSRRLIKVVVVRGPGPDGTGAGS